MDWLKTFIPYKKPSFQATRGGSHQLSILMMIRSEDQVNTILALSKSPPSAPQIRRLAYAFDWRKPKKALQSSWRMGPNKWPPEMARWKWKKQMTWIINESKWPKMKGLCSSWFLMDSLSAVTTFEALSKIQLARCHGMPNASEKSNLRIIKVTSLTVLFIIQIYPAAFSQLSTGHEWHLTHKRHPLPSSVFGFNTGEDSFRSHDQTERSVFLVYLFDFICSYIYIYIYIYTYIHVFFWILLMTVGIVRCSTFYRLDAKDGCLTWEWNFRWMPVIVLTPHVQASMKGKWVQGLRCMPCCATGVWRYVLM